MEETSKPIAFAKQCTHCNKILKNQKSYDTHVNTQSCYSKEELTYCKLCKIMMTSRNDYIKHILSIEHINTIGCNNLETLNNNQPSTILQADPFLTQHEAHTIGTNNLGNKLTFVYNNDTTQIINLIHSPQKDIMGHNVKDNIQHDMPDNNDNKELTPNAKQIKILDILASAKNHIDASNKLTRILESKLNIEDYHGLQHFINYDARINTEYQTIYSGIINNFISILIKKRNSGETTYNDKNISTLVISLTTI